MNTTVVSALFYIGRDKWQHYNLDQMMYLGWYKNTLSLNTNHVIYTDNHFYDQVRNIVDKCGTSKNITIIRQKLEELPAYIAYHKQMSDLMSSGPFKAKIPFQVPEAIYPLYNIIMFNKVHFLMDAVMRNIYGSTHFVWADAGGLREAHSNYSNVVWPNDEKMLSVDKSKVHFFSHHPKLHIHNREQHSLSQMRYIQGTAFFVTPTSLAKFMPLFDETVKTCLNAGYIGSDEKVFDLCYIDQPDLFTLEVSGWRQYFDRYK